MFLCDEHANIIDCTTDIQQKLEQFFELLEDR
jgi:hypothetical protein